MKIVLVLMLFSFTLHAQSKCNQGIKCINYNVQYCGSKDIKFKELNDSCEVTAVQIANESHQLPIQSFEIFCISQKVTVYPIIGNKITKKVLAELKKFPSGTKFIISNCIFELEGKKALISGNQFSN